MRKVPVNTTERCDFCGGFLVSEAIWVLVGEDVYCAGMCPVCARRIEVCETCAHWEEPEDPVKFGYCHLVEGRRATGSTVADWWCSHWSALRAFTVEEVKTRLGDRLICELKLEDGDA